jgi:hypothetical protein
MQVEQLQQISRALDHLRRTAVGRVDGAKVLVWMASLWHHYGV